MTPPPIPPDFRAMASAFQLNSMILTSCQTLSVQPIVLPCCTCSVTQISTECCLEVAKMLRLSNVFRGGFQGGVAGQQVVPLRG